MFRSVTLIAAVIAFSGSANATIIQGCTASAPDVSEFILARVVPMPETPDAPPSDRWVQAIRSDLAGSEAKLRAFCVAHPDMPMAFAFQTLFDGD